MSGTALGLCQQQKFVYQLFRYPVAKGSSSAIFGLEKKVGRAGFRQLILAIRPHFLDAAISIGPWCQIFSDGVAHESLQQKLAAFTPRSAEF